MKVLVIGSGGREHALCWSLSVSMMLTKLWCAPGNPGIAAVAETVPIGVDDIAGLVAFARAKDVDLVVPGPEAPLVAGLADAMAAAGIACCGPSAAAARLEGSKSFAKEVCDAARHPDRELGALHRGRGGAGIRAQAGRADRGQGRWAGGGEGRGGGGHRGRGAGGDRRDDGGAGVRRCRGERGDRGMPRRRGDFRLCAMRRHRRPVAGGGAGPQAGGRRRHRAEHRRHGGLLAAPGFYARRWRTG